MSDTSGTDPLLARIEVLEQAVSQLQMIFNDPRVARRFGGVSVFAGQTVTSQRDAARVEALQKQVADLQAAENERLKKQVAELEAQVKGKTPADDSV